MRIRILIAICLIIIFGSVLIYSLALKNYYINTPVKKIGEMELIALSQQDKIIRKGELLYIDTIYQSPLIKTPEKKTKICST